MKTKYQLQIDSRGKQATFIITYSGKQLKTIERKRGELLPDQWSKLWQLVPQHLETLKALLHHIDEGKGVEITEIELSKSKSLYSQMVGSFMAFYEEREKIKYAFTATDGNCIKAIDKKLAVNATTEEEILATWKLILDNWDSLEPFYKKQMNLTQINSNLNTVLRQIKDGKTTGKSKAQSRADDLRRGFKA